MKSRILDSHKYTQAFRVKINQFFFSFTKSPNIHQMLSMPLNNYAFLAHKVLSEHQACSNALKLSMFLYHFTTFPASIRRQKSDECSAH